MNRHSKNKISAKTTLMWVALILLFAWNQGGTVLWQAARYHHYKQRSARACRDTITLETTAFHLGDGFSWVKKDEITYRGRMFDVKKILANGSSTLLIGEFDEEDDKLYKWLAELMGEDAPDPAKSKFTCWEFEATMPASFYFHSNQVATAKPSCGYAPSTLFTRNNIPPSPPPQYC